VFVAGYGHFLRTAASVRWDEAGIDLGPDAEAWPRLDPRTREQVHRLLAGFCVAETAVATEIVPFAAAAVDPDVAACFEAQAIDERRHARFFDRVAAEVAGTPGEGPAERRNALCRLLEDEFVGLFETRLPAVARALAHDAPAASLAAAVSLYHLLLEGVVFAAGQLALVRLLDVGALHGLRRGVELVLRDERWHIGFGARLLEDLGLAETKRAERVLEEAETMLAAWGDAIDPELGRSVLKLHRRRLSAAGLTGRRGPEERSLVQAASCNSSGPPLTPFATATS
jgi:ribonucleoside-diphosphate reductase beta chain